MPLMHSGCMPGYIRGISFHIFSTYLQFPVSENITQLI